jgi:hypothetical protein
MLEKKSGLIVMEEVSTIEYKKLIENVYLPLINNSKRPIVKKWQALEKTPLNMYEKNCNWGILCGKINGFIVVDIDVKDGKYKIAKEFIKQYDLINKCEYIVKTTSGGYHFYFKYDESIRTCHPKFNEHSFIDICSNGSFVVCPPSVVNSKEYVVMKGSFDKMNNMDDEIKSFITGWTNRTKINPKKIKSYVEIDYSVDKIDSDDLVMLDKIMFSDGLIKMNYNYNDWFLITKILKKYNCFDLWDRWSNKTANGKKHPKYDKSNNMIIWNSIKINLVSQDIYILQYLYNSTNENNDKIYLNDKTYRQITKTIENKIEINQQYLMESKNKLDEKIEEIVDSNDVVLIKSHMESGKTTFMIKYMENRDDKFISICSRVSLVDDQYNKFVKNSERYAHYQEKGAFKNYLITTIDSLLNLEVENFFDRIVYIDEISSLLNYISHAEYFKNRKLIMKKFILILMNAKKIIATDADLNDSVFELFNMINKKYVFIKNNYYKKMESNHYTTENFQNFLNQYINKAHENKTVFCSDTKKQCDHAYESLIQSGIKKEDIVLITSDYNSNKDLIKTELWENKHIIYSPSIVYGVDFVPNTLYDVFVYVEQKSINPIQIGQQIFRCRRIKNIYSCIDKKIKQPSFINLEDVKKYYEHIGNQNILDVHQVIDADYLDKDSEIKDIFNYLFYYTKLQESMTTSNYYKYITMIIKSKGIETFNMEEINNKIILDKNVIVEKGNDYIMMKSKEKIDIALEQNSLKKIDCDTPILKRLEYLNLIDEKRNKKENLNNIQKFEEYIYNDDKFKEHINNCHVMDFVFEPKNIQSKFHYKNNTDFLVKINESSIGILENLRKLQYEKFNETTFETIKKITRLRAPYDDNFKYKVFRHLNSNLYQSMKINSLDKRNKHEFKINNDELKINTELRKLRKEEHISVSYDIFEIFNI